MTLATREKPAFVFIRTLSQQIGADVPAAKSLLAVMTSVTLSLTQSVAGHLQCQEPQELVSLESQSSQSQLLDSARTPKKRKNQLCQLQEQPL